MLDLAKPLYLDVFLEIIYTDHICESPRIEYALDDGIIVITMNICTDRLRQELLNVKRRFLIDPRFQYSRDMGCSLEEYVPQLAFALFSCACLTRDFKRHWDSLFRNIVVGVVLSQATDLKKL